MISVNHIDQMSADERAVETSRILNAFAEEVIYCVRKNDPKVDVIEALFKASGVRFKKVLIHEDTYLFQKV